MDSSDSGLQQKARFAGILYFLIGIFGFFGIMYVPSQIEVIGDAQATFNNLLENEFLFSTSIYSQQLTAELNVIQMLDHSDVLTVVG